jgi:hypothetical protein
MNEFRMTSDPTAATSFATRQERIEALRFARDYKTANLHSMPERVQYQSQERGFVYLPTFLGDLWVARA